jgi:hypothetical protein
VDVSAFIHHGENSVAVLVWYFGRHGFSHRDSGMPGLLMDTETAEFSAWKVRKHPAYFDAVYIRDAFRLSENSVGFDARRDMPGWMNPEFDDSAWLVAEAAGSPGTEPWGPLEKRETPQWFWSELKEYQSVEARSGFGGDGYVYYHCKLPHNAQFVPALVLQSRAGVRIDITVAQDTNCLCPAYITDEGEQAYECIGWMNGEEVIYAVPSDAEVIRLAYRETGFSTRFEGGFQCDDPVLNRLWGKSRRTLYVTMRDTFMDCPCRERAQWPGDLVIQLGQVPYCLGREADLLVKKGLRETLRWQREDGIIYGPVPEGNWRMELPAQMLAVISQYGIWTYYMNTGDFQTLKELYPFAKRYLDIWEFEKSGLVKYRPDKKGAAPQRVDGVHTGTWDWIDWGERIDAEPALNAWFVLAAQSVRQMAERLGLDQDALEIGRKQGRVLSAIRRTFWNEAKGGYCSAEFEYAPDDRVQALMILCGAATPDQYLTLKHIFETVEQAGPYMEKYVIEALFTTGDAGAALKRMKHRYRGLVENGNSTLWERWPEWSTHPGTINHSWSGGPLTLLSERVAGIRPLVPGWARFSIRPRPGKLKVVSAVVLVPQGEIRFTAQKSGTEWNVQVTVPKGTVAQLDLFPLGGAEDPKELAAGVWSFEAGAIENRGFGEALCV